MKKLLNLEAPFKIKIKLKFDTRGFILCKKRILLNLSGFLYIVDNSSESKKIPLWEFF